MKNNIPYNDNLYLLRFLNGRYENDKIIDTYLELTWVSKAWVYGDAMIKFSKDDKIIPYLKAGLLMSYENSIHPMIITSVQYDSEEGVSVELRCLKWILARRTLYKVYTFQDTPLLTVLNTILNDNVISPSNSLRKIETFRFEPISDSNLSAIKVTGQYLNTDIYSMFSDIFTKERIPWQIILDNGSLVMSIWSGVNRSTEQTTNKAILFSEEYGNLRSSKVTKSDLEYSTTVLVGGEGDGASKVLVDYSIENVSDLNRYEMYEEAHDISSDTESGTISDAAYRNLLYARGKEVQAKNNTRDVFQGEVEDYSGLRIRKANEYLFNIDYNLGDIVTFENSFLTDRVRVMEIIHSVSSAEHVVYPGFASLQDEEDA